MTSEQPVVTRLYRDEPVMTSDKARDAIEAALNDYRTSYWHDDGSGMALIDLLSPGPTVEEGQKELHLLADDVANALTDAGLLVERDDKAELVRALRTALESLAAVAVFDANHDPHFMPALSANNEADAEELTRAYWSARDALAAVGEAEGA